MIQLILFLAGIRVINSLANDVAQKPPMGWSSWHAYGCESCTSISDNQCLTEASIKDVVNTMTDDGFTTAGYEFIILDDGWQADYRNGVHLQPNSQRFPTGMIDLADFIHNKNMKLGLFSDLGPTSGCGLPGTAEHFKEDADTFAHWGVDYVKMSGFTANPYAMDVEYPLFGYYLHETKRKMVYATSWPVLQQSFDQYFRVNYWSVATYCNTWRFARDVLPNWNTLLNIMDTYAYLQSRLIVVVQENKMAWNDADLLVVGQNNVTLDQCRAQMAVWSIIPSPLIFSKHPRSLTAEQRALLKNEAVIKVNQDDLGLPGERFDQRSNIDIWRRRIAPTSNLSYSYAIAFVNTQEYGLPIEFTIPLHELGLRHIPGYFVTDLFPSRTSFYSRTVMEPTAVLRMRINPSGVAFFKAEVIVNQNIYYAFLPPPTEGIVRHLV
ncbi:hypothetical protein V9T40_006084 [Parthenolecanium corni]|uniref:Alpha-galactosidase n=1 Tax=Parthenolecanium corni TaxID=536013 RepID=A0AAN9U490_9HEMI